MHIFWHLWELFLSDWEDNIPDYEPSEEIDESTYTTIEESESA